MGGPVKLEQRRPVLFRQPPPGASTMTTGSAKTCALVLDMICSAPKNTCTAPPPPPKEFWAMAPVLKRQSAQSAEWLVGGLSDYRRGDAKMPVDRPTTDAGQWIRSGTSRTPAGLDS